jgi:hypothetical protein
MRRAPRIGELGAHVPPDEIDEVRILATWLASHPGTLERSLEPRPDRETLEGLLAELGRGERELEDRRVAAGVADGDVGSRGRLAPHEGQGDRAQAR